MLSDTKLAARGSFCLHELTLTSAWTSTIVGARHQWREALVTISKCWKYVDDIMAVWSKM